MFSSLVRSSARNVMFKPPVRPLASKFKADDRNVLIKSLDGEYVHCRLVCPWGAETCLQSYSGTTNAILFMHGNADDVQSSTSYCQWLADHLVTNVFVFDYPGYGYSSGLQSEEGMEDAAVAVTEYLTTKLEIGLSNLVVLGKSIGSYPAIALAAHPVFRTHLRGLVLLSAVASAARCIFDFSVVPRFLKHTLDGVALANITRVPDVHTLMFVVHGINDEVVGIDNAHALIQAAKPHTCYPPLWLEAGHNDMESLHQGLLLDTLKEFLVQCDKRVERRDSATCPYDAFV